VDREYYRIGLWDNEAVSNREILSNHFKKLEHSNGINNINFGVRRRFNIQKLESTNFKVELGFTPSIGIIYTATQGKVINPDGSLEVYNPGNKLGGYNHGLETDLRFYIKKHWLIGLNFNYFHLRIRKAKLEKGAYINQNIIGSNYGISFGYKF